MIHIRAKILIAAAAYFLTGCITVPLSTKAFERPKQAMTPAQSEKLLQTYAVHVSPGFQHIGAGPSIGDAEMAAYMRASGCPAAADKLKGASLALWLPFGLGAAAYWALEATTQWNGLKVPVFASSLLAQTLILDGRYREPAAETFNAALRRSLGLDPSAPIVDPFAMNLSSHDPRGKYMILTGGARYNDNRYISEYLRANGWVADPPPDWSLAGEMRLGAGTVFSNGFGYEWLFGLPISTSYKGRVQSAPGTSAFDLKYGYTLWTLVLSPGYTWSIPSPFSNGRARAWLGLGLGGAYASGDPGLGGNWLMDPAFRVSVPVSQRLAYGLEVGYRQCSFSNFTSGGILSPQVTINRTVDFSGPSLALTFEIGSIPFTK